MFYSQMITRTNTNKVFKSSSMAFTSIISLLFVVVDTVSGSRTRNLTNEKIQLVNPSQSSTYGSNSDWGASNALDGQLLRHSIPVLGCSHTEKEQNPWWKAQLVKTSHVTMIRIFPRTDGCQDRYTHVTVSTSTDGNTWVLCKDLVDRLMWSSTWVEATCPQGTIASFVKVVQHNREPLTLCEVEVYGKPVKELATTAPPATAPVQSVRTWPSPKTTKATATVAPTTAAFCFVDYYVEYVGESIRCTDDPRVVEHPWRDCSRYCLSDGECRYWTWYNNKHPGQGIATCCLFKSYSYRQNNDGAFSGPRGCMLTAVPITRYPTLLPHTWPVTEVPATTSAKRPATAVSTKAKTTCYVDIDVEYVGVRSRCISVDRLSWRKCSRACSSSFYRSQCAYWTLYYEDRKNISCCFFLSVSYRHNNVKAISGPRGCGVYGGDIPITRTITEKLPHTWPATKAPTTWPASTAPTIWPATKAPATWPPATKAPTTWPATEAPTTRAQTKAPTTRAQTKAPTTRAQTKAPTLSAQTKAPTTAPTKGTMSHMIVQVFKYIQNLFIFQ